MGNSGAGKVTANTVEKVFPANTHAFPMPWIQEPNRAMAQGHLGSARDLIEANLNVVHGWIGHEHRTGQFQ
jgi:hypothetical protein